MATRERSPGEPVEARAIALRGGVAVALSLLANWLLLGAALSTDLVEPFDSLSVPPVTFLTAVGAAGAAVVYWLLARRSDSPDRTFAIVAAVVLVLSLVPDVLLLEFDPAATVSGVLVLVAMHAVVAAICVAALTGRITGALERASG